MKKVYKYFVLLGLVAFSSWYIYRVLPLNMDGIWNYGFAYNISKGLIPYLDYNMIIPPLWPYLVSIPVYFIGNHLVINNNFFEFVNYCFLGMLDFTNNSNDSFLLFFFIEIIVVGYLFVAFLKSKKRSLLYIMFK